MKIATFNINGIKARLPRLLEWLEETRPAVACLQEIKSQDDGFRAADIEALGYSAIWHGQKSFNGVAILVDTHAGYTLIEVQRGLGIPGPNEGDEEQARYLEADVSGVRVACLYLPNGNPHPGPKFTYKLAWMEKLRARMAEIWAEEVPAVVLGDFNVIPEDDDVWSMKAMAGDALMQPESRAAYARFLTDGWTDALRTHNPRGGVDVLGLSGRRVAARPRLPDRPHSAVTRMRRPPRILRRRQGASRPGESQRPRAGLGTPDGVILA